MKPTINILYINSREIPSGGGTIRITVQYKDYTVINNPITYAGGNTVEFIRPEECVAAGDIYNYVFEITATNQTRDILFNFHAQNDGESEVAGMRIYQNGPTGDEDIDLGEIPMLNQARIEGIQDMYPYTKGEYFFSTYLNAVAIGALKVVRIETDVNWLEIEYYDSATKGHNYYREDWVQWTLRINKNIYREKREGVINFKVQNIETDEILDTKTVTITQSANPNPIVFNKIEVEEDSKVYVNTEGSYYFPVRVNMNIDDEVGEIRTFSSVEWLNFNLRGGGTNIEEDGYITLNEDYVINVTANTSEENRLAETYLSYYDSNGNFLDEKVVWILQEGTLNSPNKEYRSVWEDIIYEIDADVFNYEVVMSTNNINNFSDNTTIFEGRAYKYPNADVIKIKMNKIFENYLSNSFVPMIDDTDVETIIKGDINTYITNFEASKRFLIINRDTNEVVKEYVVLYDWNYKYKWRGEDTILSKPINNDNAINMVELNTTVNGIGIVTNYFNNENKINSCGNYCLYYLNSYGGWDTLLLNNKVKKTKNINSYTTERYFSRLNVDFEQMKYISELQNNYVFNTNFLTDEQAKNLVDNLFTSNEVYIHDLKENIIYSALITDNNVTYKQYSDNLNLVQYTINIKESQIQLKR